MPKVKEQFSTSIGRRSFAKKRKITKSIILKLIFDWYINYQISILIINMKDKKRAMGRGLGAILSAESKSNINSATDTGAEQLVGNMVEVALEDIYPNATQPRTYFDETALQELAQSIRNLGVIQPITLRKDGDKFEIISGERRYRASKIAGLKSVPAYIRLVNDQELLEMALVENIQREDLDAIEVALTYQRLLDEIGLTQENLSQRVGKEEVQLPILYVY
jgi:ParB family chromosome partitioning protein